MRSSYLADKDMSYPCNKCKFTLNTESTSKGKGRKTCSGVLPICPVKISLHKRKHKEVIKEKYALSALSQKRR